MTTKLARDLVEGDMIDLEGDRYATMILEGASRRDREDHESTVSTFAFELALVEEIEYETDTCIVLHTSLTSFACPPDHPLSVVED